VELNRRIIKEKKVIDDTIAWRLESLAEKEPGDCLEAKKTEKGKKVYKVTVVWRL
jgi:hypothetical protein